MARKGSYYYQGGKRRLVRKTIKTVFLSVVSAAWASIYGRARKIPTLIDSRILMDWSLRRREKQQHTRTPSETLCYGLVRSHKKLPLCHLTDCLPKNNDRPWIPNRREWRNERRGGRTSQKDISRKNEEDSRFAGRTGKERKINSCYVRPMTDSFPAIYDSISRASAGGENLTHLWTLTSLTQGRKLIIFSEKNAGWVMHDLSRDWRWPWVFAWSPRSATRGPFLVALNAKKEAFNDLENHGKETCNARNRLIGGSREINGWLILPSSRANRGATIIHALSSTHPWYQGRWKITIPLVVWAHLGTFFAGDKCLPFASLAINSIFASFLALEIFKTPRILRRFFFRTQHRSRNRGILRSTILIIFNINTGYLKKKSRQMFFFRKLRRFQPQSFSHFQRWFVTSACLFTEWRKVSLHSTGWIPRCEFGYLLFVAVAEWAGLQISHCLHNLSKGTFVRTRMRTFNLRKCENAAWQRDTDTNAWCGR